MSVAPEMTPDALRTLMDAAGIPIDESRLPDLVAEYTAQIGFVAMVDAVLATAPATATTPYDPAFPASDEGGVR